MLTSSNQHRGLKLSALNVALGFVQILPLLRFFRRLIIIHFLLIWIVLNNAFVVGRADVLLVCVVLAANGQSLTEKRTARGRRNLFQHPPTAVLLYYYCTALPGFADGGVEDDGRSFQNDGFVVRLVILQ